MSKYFIGLTVIGMLFACGEHKSKTNPHAPITQVPLVTPKTPGSLPALDNTQYRAIRADFKGSYIGVIDGQLHNFNQQKEVGEPVQFVFAHSSDATQTQLGTLQRRPQRIDQVNDDFVLLQRPHFQVYSNGQSKTFEQDCFLINIKTGMIWKFDEFFPILNSIQYVTHGGSKKLLFIARKKADSDTTAGSNDYIDIKKDYNYPEEGWSRSLPTSSPKVIVSIDFSDSQQVTLRPISGGLDDIANYLADAHGNVLAQTAQTSSISSRTLAILQNEQTPTEVTIHNANINPYSSYESRVLVDSKQNFWRFSRQSSSTGLALKAERLILARDLDNRPALLPLATVTRELNSWSFRLDGNTYTSPYRGNELFAFTGLVVVAAPTSAEMKILSDSQVQVGNLQLSKAALDLANGKMLSYLQPYSTGTPWIMEFDLGDLNDPKVSSYIPDSKNVFGSLQKMSADREGGIIIETLDGSKLNSYRYEGATGQYNLLKSERLQTDNRVRILIPVSSID